MSYRGSDDYKAERRKNENKLYDSKSSKRHSERTTSSKENSTKISSTKSGEKMSEDSKRSSKNKSEKTSRRKSEERTAKKSDSHKSESHRKRKSNDRSHSRQRNEPSKRTNGKDHKEHSPSSKSNRSSKHNSRESRKRDDSKSERDDYHQGISKQRNYRDREKSYGFGYRSSPTRIGSHRSNFNSTLGTESMKNTNLNSSGSLNSSLAVGSIFGGQFRGPPPLGHPAWNNPEVWGPPASYWGPRGPPPPGHPAWYEAMGAPMPVVFGSFQSNYNQKRERRRRGSSFENEMCENDEKKVDKEVKESGNDARREKEETKKIEEKLEGPLAEEKVAEIDQVLLCDYYAWVKSPVYTEHYDIGCIVQNALPATTYEELSKKWNEMMGRDLSVDEMDKKSQMIEDRLSEEITNEDVKLEMNHEVITSVDQIKIEDFDDDTGAKDENQSLEENGMEVDDLYADLYGDIDDNENSKNLISEAEENCQANQKIDLPNIEIQPDMTKSMISTLLQLESEFVVPRDCELTSENSVRGYELIEEALCLLQGGDSP